MTAAEPGWSPHRRVSDTALSQAEGPPTRAVAGAWMVALTSFLPCPTVFTPARSSCSLLSQMPPSRERHRRSHHKREGAPPRRTDHRVHRCPTGGVCGRERRGGTHRGGWDRLVPRGDRWRWRRHVGTPTGAFASRSARSRPPPCLPPGQAAPLPPGSAGQPSPLRPPLWGGIISGTNCFGGQIVLRASHFGGESFWGQIALGVNFFGGE